jgi:hypothetical protein
MGNISYTYRRETRDIHFVFSNFFRENRAVYEIRLENTVKSGRPHMAIWRMRISYRIPKATNTRAGCVIFIAFPL